jgi:hypothetical protein
LIGRRLAHCEITAQIGSAGMGEAIDHLEQLWSERPELVSGAELKSSPLYDPLRKNAGFAHLLESS